MLCGRYARIKADVQCIIILESYADQTYIECMDLRRLRTFVAVAELGTVSKAALRLRITRPALDRRRRAVPGRLSRCISPYRRARRAGRSAPAWRQGGAEGCRPAPHDRKCFVEVSASIC